MPHAYNTRHRCLLAAKDQGRGREKFVRFLLHALGGGWFRPTMPRTSVAADFIRFEVTGFTDEDNAKALMVRGAELRGVRRHHSGRARNHEFHFEHLLRSYEPCEPPPSEEQQVVEVVSDNDRIARLEARLEALLEVVTRPAIPETTTTATNGAAQ